MPDLPSWLCGFDSRHPLQSCTSQTVSSSFPGQEKGCALRGPVRCGQHTPLVDQLVVPSASAASRVCRVAARQNARSPAVISSMMGTMSG